MAQAMASQCTTTPTIPHSDVYSSYTFNILLDDRIDASTQEENIDNTVIVDTWFWCNDGSHDCDDYKKVKVSLNSNNRIKVACCSLASGGVILVLSCDVTNCIISYIFYFYWHPLHQCACTFAQS